MLQFSIVFLRFQSPVVQKYIIKSKFKLFNINKTSVVIIFKASNKRFLPEKLVNLI